jgi:NTE family protein
MVATDVKHYRPVIFGENPDDLVLDSMLASAAIPPWIPPMTIGEHVLVDGGAVSDVPIEPAIRHGATEIIALDLFNPPPHTASIKGVAGLLDRVFATMENRHIELELQLAALKGVTVHRWQLQYDQHIPMWDLSHTHNLIHAGYALAKEYLANELRREQEADVVAPTVKPTSAALLWRRLRERFSVLISN